MVVYEDNEVFRLAACLDPRFNLEWCQDANKREAVTAELSVKAVDYAPPEASAVSVGSPAKKRSKLFSFMTSCNSSTSISHG